MSITSIGQAAECRSRLGDGYRPHRPLQPDLLRPQPTHDDRLLSAALVAELGRAPVYDFTVNHVVLPGHPCEMVRTELLRRAAVRATAGGGSVG